MKDELLGLAADPYADPVFRNQNLNMDVLYRTGETPQVEIFYIKLQSAKFLFYFSIELMIFIISIVMFLSP